MAPIVSYSHCKFERHISKHITGFLVESLNIFILKKMKISKFMELFMIS